MRRTTKIVKSISGLFSAVKGLDLNRLMAGLQSFQEGFEGVQQVYELAKTAYEGGIAVYEGEHDRSHRQSQEGYQLQSKAGWYSALRDTDTLINGGELAKFRVLVCGAPCRRELAFQWGVCQRLGSLAGNVVWYDNNRRGAVRFLEDIYRNDLAWGQNPPVKAYQESHSTLVMN